MQKGNAHVQRLVMTTDLFPQPIDLLFHPDVSDREDELLDGHLLIDEMFSVWLQGLFTLLQRVFEILDRECCALLSRVSACRKCSTQMNAHVAAGHIVSLARPAL